MPDLRVPVVLVERILPHPNGHSLDVLDLSNNERVVTGKHYALGQRGIYIPAGALIPNWLAKDLWLVGQGNKEPWHTVVAKTMRGITSPGLFAGATFRKTPAHDIEAWPYWKEDWTPGHDVAGHLGIRFP